MDAGLKLIKYYSDAAGNHAAILEGNMAELTLNSLSKYREEVEVLKSAVAILSNIIEAVCRSQLPRHKKLIKADLLKGSKQIYFIKIYKNR